jgi:hypothetical protein
VHTGWRADKHILKQSVDRYAAKGRFLVPAFQLVNIVQMIINNVRASSSAKRYTPVIYTWPVRQLH